MIKVSYQEAIEFTNTAKEYLNSKTRQPSSLTYALDRMIKRLRVYIDEFQEMVEDQKAKFQMKDKDGCFLYYDAANSLPKFTAENHASFRKAFNELKKQEFEVEPFHATTIPSDLEVAWYSYFVPFVISEDQIPT